MHGAGMSLGVGLGLGLGLGAGEGRSGERSSVGLFGEGFVGGLDRGFVEVTGLEEEGIFLSEGLAFFEEVGAVAFFGEAFFAPRVGGEEPVGAGVPVGGVVVVGGVIHHGDDDFFTTAIGTVVADPAGPFSPGVFVEFAF